MGNPRTRRWLPTDVRGGEFTRSNDGNNQYAPSCNLLYAMQCYMLNIDKLYNAFISMYIGKILYEPGYNILVAIYEKKREREYHYGIDRVATYFTFISTEISNSG